MELIFGLSGLELLCAISAEVKNRKVRKSEKNIFIFGN